VFHAHQRPRKPLRHTENNRKEQQASSEIPRPSTQYFTRSVIRSVPVLAQHTQKKRKQKGRVCVPLVHFFPGQARHTTTFTSKSAHWQSKIVIVHSSPGLATEGTAQKPTEHSLTLSRGGSAKALVGQINIARPLYQRATNSSEAGLQTPSWRASCVQPAARAFNGGPFVFESPFPRWGFEGRLACFSFLLVLCNRSGVLFGLLRCIAVCCCWWWWCHRRLGSFEYIFLWPLVHSSTAMGGCRDGWPAPPSYRSRPYTRTRTHTLMPPSHRSYSKN